MITLITGVPGSGKSLYTVGVLVQDLLKSTFQYQGEATKRTVYTNIKDLLLEHEKIDADNLNTWHEWVKAGDVIVYDEVQEVWRPRSMGSKVPMHIEKLETHRHMGVDFVLITQHPMLLDQNIRRLVGKHIHVRRVGSMPFAILYEWDHASNPNTVSTALSKTSWRFDKSFYKLYKSAEAHTKQKFQIPFFVYIFIAAVIAAIALSPYMYKRYKERTGGAPVVKSETVVSQGNTTGVKIPQIAETAPSAQQKEPEPLRYPLEDLKAVPAGFKPLGCVATKKRCACYGQAGEVIEVTQPQCIKASTEIAYISTGHPQNTVAFSSTSDAKKEEIKPKENEFVDSGFNLPVMPVNQKYGANYTTGQSGNFYAKNLPDSKVMMADK